MGAFVDLTGQVFDKLTLLSYAKGSRINNKRLQWVCKCVCGNIVSRTDKHLKRNKINSCGCHLIYLSKVCTECKIDKLLSEYHKCNANAHGIQSKCKKCLSDLRKEVYRTNRESILAEQTIKRASPKNKEKTKKYYEKNKDKYKNNYQKIMQDEIRKKRRKDTSDKYRSKSESKEKSRQQKLEYSKRHEVVLRKRQKHLIRQKSDIQYVLKRRLRFRLRHAINAIANGNHKYKSAIELLGCDISFFKQHIESMFTEGMNWDRLTYIHIDHIKPCAKFDLTDIEEQKKCFHYTNLQPLWYVDNLIKNAKYKEPDY